MARYAEQHADAEAHANKDEQNECLLDGYFDGCAPGNLVCLCNLPQDDVDRYVETVQPCLDGEPGKKTCTLGAVASKLVM